MSPTDRSGPSVGHPVTGEDIAWPVIVFDIDGVPNVCADRGALEALFEPSMWDEEVESAFDRILRPLRLSYGDDGLSVEAASAGGASREAFHRRARLALVQFSDVKSRRYRSARGAERTRLLGLDDAVVQVELVRRFSSEKYRH